MRSNDMANFNQIETNAKVWATGHLVAAAAIALAVGFILGVILI
jgi:hypothetical protein